MEDLVAEGTVIYHKVYGNTLIPKTFVVPDVSPQWPSHLLGFELGKIADGLRTKYRHGRLTEEQTKKLDAVDFAWSFNEYKWYRQILPALVTYGKLFGDMLVPRNFVVPANPDWPRAAWGRSLGKTVNNIRNRRKELEPRYRANLDSIGFVWTVTEAAKVEPIPRRAPEQGEPKKRRIETPPPQEPVVSTAIKKKPIPTPTYPSKPAPTWSLSSSSPVHQMRSVFLPALYTYQALYGPVGGMSDAFVVPAESPWPVVAWGVQLGRLTRDLLQGTYVEGVPDDCRSDLLQLGFPLWSAHSSMCSRLLESDSPENQTPEDLNQIHLDLPHLFPVLKPEDGEYEYDTYNI